MALSSLLSPPPPLLFFLNDEVLQDGWGILNDELAVSFPLHIFSEV